MAGRYRILYYNLNKYFLRFLPDSLFHNILGWIMHKRFKESYHWMNIKKPKTFNEKIQWLKKQEPIEVKTRLSDKYDVREWISQKIGEKYLIDLLPLNSTGSKVAYSIEEIDFSVLPKQFVLKLTKGSGFNIICHDKFTLNYDLVMIKK